MVKIYLHIVLVFTCISLVYCTFVRTKKVYIRIYHMRNCQTNPNTKQLFILEFQKYNRTDSYLNLNWTVLEPFDRTYDAHVHMWKWGDGGWKKNFYRLTKDNACDSFYFFLGPIWTRLIDKAKIKRGCPINPGYYSVKEYTQPPGSTGQILAWPGRFLLFVKISKHNKLAMCIETELAVEEMYY